THPHLAGCARTFADVFDLQHEPAHRDLLTMPSPTNGEPVSLSYLPPRTLEDLTRKRAMMEHLMRRSGAVVGRLPQHAGTIVRGLYDVRVPLSAEAPTSGPHAAAYLEHCRENDRAVCLAFHEPQRDRGRPSQDERSLHVLEERDDGIVVRGVRGVATS